MPSFRFTSCSAATRFICKGTRDRPASQHHPGSTASIRLRSSVSPMLLSPENAHGPPRSLRGEGIHAHTPGASCHSLRSTAPLSVPEVEVLVKGPVVSTASTVSIVGLFSAMSTSP